MISSYQLAAMLFGLAMCGLILMAVELHRLRRALNESDQRNALQIASNVSRIDGAHTRQSQLCRDVRSLYDMMKGQVAIDLAYKDVGWLIFIANVGGRDMVRIQHIRGGVSPQEYRQLVERLSFDMAHIAYIDGPPHYEQFLLSDDELARRSKRRKT